MKVTGYGNSRAACFYIEDIRLEEAETIVPGKAQLLLEKCPANLHISIAQARQLLSRLTKAIAAHEAGK